MYSPVGADGERRETMTPKKVNGFRWNISKEAVDAELARQKTEVVDFTFCLKWHSFEFNKGIVLVW